MRTYRFGRKIILPSTIAIKYQIRKLMAEDEARRAGGGSSRPQTLVRARALDPPGEPAHRRRPIGRSVRRRGFAARGLADPFNASEKIVRI
jgi:hypothetical protein